MRDMLAVIAAKSLQLDTQTIAIITGTLIPIIVGLVTKSSASAGLKSALNLLGSAVAAALTSVVTNGGTLVVGQFVSTVGLTWITSIGTYYGFLKPTGIAGSIAAKTKHFGLGSPPILETDDKGEEDKGLSADLNEKSKPTLVGMAKKAHIPGYSRMTKVELVKALEKAGK